VWVDHLPNFGRGVWAGAWGRDAKKEITEGVFTREYAAPDDTIPIRRGLRGDSRIGFLVRAFGWFPGLGIDGLWGVVFLLSGVHVVSIGARSGDVRSQNTPCQSVAYRVRAFL